MRIVVNFRNDSIIIGDITYSLEDFKQFLIEHYAPLVEKQFVKAIWKSGYTAETLKYHNGQVWVSETTIYRSGRVVFTYDWYEIIKRAERTVKPVFDFIMYNNLHRCNYTI